MENTLPSFENTVVINETTTPEGMEAEYAWLEERYPDFMLIEQSVVRHEGTPYDKIDFETADGDEMTVYFDISNFFGKF